MDSHALIVSLEGLLASAISAAVVHLLLMVAAHFKLKVSLGQEAQLQMYAKQAAVYAEEWAAAKFKLENQVVSGKDKLEAASTMLLEKVPGIDPTEAAGIVRSVLPGLGIGAVNALGKIAAAMQSGPDVPR